MYILGTFLITLLCIFIFPISINITYNKENKVNDKSKNIAVIKIARLIPVARINLNKKKNKKHGEDRVKKILNMISNIFTSIINYNKKNRFYFSSTDIIRLNNAMKYKRVNLNIGINFYNEIINAYIIAGLNTLMNLYIYKNVKLFDLKNTMYNTYISEKIYNLSLELEAEVKSYLALYLFIKIVIKNFVIKKKTKIKLDSKQNKQNLKSKYT